MKIIYSKLLCFSVMLMAAPTALASLATLSTTLPVPSVYYTASPSNYLITKFNFYAGIVLTGADISSELIPYLYISASDTFTYWGKTCSGGRGGGKCTFSTLTSGSSSSGVNNVVYQPGDQLDASYHFSLYQPQNVAFAITVGMPYTLQLFNAANALVSPDSSGIYALNGSSYTLELKTAFPNASSYAAIVGTPVAPVPVPAAGWLFVSGFMLVLVGAFRKRI